jgi:hypothetical protein
MLTLIAWLIAIIMLGLFIAAATERAPEPIEEEENESTPTKTS